MKEYFVNMTLSSELDIEDLKKELDNVLQYMKRREIIESVPKITVQKRDYP